jgi:hypothetical protein
MNNRINKLIKLSIDLPTRYLTYKDGLLFAKTLKSCDYDEFDRIMDLEPIKGAQRDYIEARLNDNQDEIEKFDFELDRIIGVEFKNTFIKLIEEYKNFQNIKERETKNTYDLDEENKLENQSFENQRSIK